MMNDSTSTGKIINNTGQPQLSLKINLSKIGIGKNLVNMAHANSNSSKQLLHNN